MKVCRHCQNQLPDEAVFCRYCGQKCEDLPVQAQGAKREDASVQIQGPESGDSLVQAQEPENRDPLIQAQELKNKKGRKKLLIGGGIAVGIVLILSLSMGLIFILKKYAGGKKEFDLAEAELVENYIHPSGSGSVNLTAMDIQPSPRDTSARWDSQLFYWLEDVGEGDDNHIADCLLTRMGLTREDNGKMLEYEVYREPSSEEIVKIVSIETLDDGTLELTDYYYQDGQPNFVFRRNDSVYTPSYASIDKVGERYYFSGRQMTKWRWIYEPSVVKQWILELEDTWYTQWAYGAITDSERALYDEKERQILNEACNTYRAIQENPQVMLIEGRVTDEGGNPLEGVEIGIGKIGDGVLENPAVKLLTDKDGSYAWAAEEPGARYFLVFQKEGWIQTVMEPSLAEEAFVQAPQEDVVLMAERKEKTYPVIIKACQFEPQIEGGTSEGWLPARGDGGPMPLADADIAVYGGINYQFGEPVAEGKTDGDGRLKLDLRPGVYTAEIRKEGFSSTQQIFFADGTDSEQAIYAFDQNAAIQRDPLYGRPQLPSWFILLTWECGEDEAFDLDSSLFTPDKAALGDRNCINTLNRSDGAGASYLYDGQGSKVCEYIILSTPQKGSYKYYVTNYSDIQQDNLFSSRMASSRAKVSLYKDGVLVKTFAVPDKKGTVWEVFELRDQQAIPIQEVYGNVEGKNWWTEDKQMAYITEDQSRASWIQSDGEWLYFVNTADENKLYYCRKDGSELTKFCDDRALNTRIVLADDQIYYTAYGSQDFVARVNTDGSNREILATVPQISEEAYGDGGSMGLRVEGYKDGTLYYYWAPEVKGSIAALPVSGQGQDFSGRNPQRIVSAGGYLYYVDYDYSTDGYSFWRQKPDGSEAGCLQEDAGWWTESNKFRIYKGWIYYIAYRQSGFELHRMKLDGTEDTVLATGIGDGGQNFIVQDGYCYYTGNDQQVYRMGITGGEPAVVGPSSGYLEILDGEVYTKDYSDWPLITASGLDGSNRREIFNSASLRRDAAMQAYASFLETYVPTGLNDNRERLQYMQFACQDIDGDGVNELFVQYISPVGSHCETDYFRYENSVKKIWDGIEADTVAVNLQSKELGICDYGNRYCGISRYNFEGKDLEYIDFYFDGGESERYNEEAAFEQAYNTYIKPYPQLHFVDNTAANRQQYIISGSGTGWDYE